MSNWSGSHFCHIANKKLINREPCPAKRKQVLSQRTIGRKGEVHSWRSLTLQITQLFPLWPVRSLTKTIVNKQLGYKTLVLFNENSLGRPFPLIVFFILMRLKSLENSIFQHHFPVVLTMLLQSYFKLCVYWRKNILLHCRQYCQPSGKKHNLVFLVRLNVSDRQTWTEIKYEPARPTFH